MQELNIKIIQKFIKIYNAVQSDCYIVKVYDREHDWIEIEETVEDEKNEFRFETVEFNQGAHFDSFIYSIKEMINLIDANLVRIFKNVELKE